MFYYIRGELVHKGENFAAVDVNGVCYKLFTSLTCLGKMGEVGSRITMYTHLHIREDIMDLYGFTSEEELKMFINLISVSGVGPKAALAILSVAAPEKLALAVVTADAKVITKAAGVGPKMAQRIILELKDKLKNSDISSVMGSDDDEEIYIEDNLGEAVNALVVLGYSPQEAKNAVSKAEKSDSVEDIIKTALKNLMKQF